MTLLKLKGSDESIQKKGDYIQGFWFNSESVLQLRRNLVAKKNRGKNGFLLLSGLIENCSPELVVIEGYFAGTALESDIDARRSESSNGEDYKMGSN
ncbi:hypothetical protein MKX03_006528 [Papaver bracteatum]|nr:hypothetical protein MKX03_006528 [Papaver bracteatum]